MNYVNHQAQWEELVQQLLDVRRPAQAEELVRQRISQYPHEVHAHVLLALTLLRQQHTAAALAAANAAAALDPQHAEAFYMISRVYMAQDQPQQALPAIDEALRIHPRTSKYLGTRAWILNSLAHWAEAVQTATAGLVTDPTHAECLLQRTLALRQQEHFDEATSTLERLIRYHPQLPVAHRLLGEEALRRHDATAAQTHFLEALRLNPTQPKARAGLVDAVKASLWLPHFFTRLDTRYKAFSQPIRFKAGWQTVLRQVATKLGALLVVALVVGLFCLPLLLLYAFAGVQWRLHPAIRQLRNRPSGAGSYLHQTIRRYGPLAATLLALLSVLANLVWLALWLGLPSSVLGPGLTGGLTVGVAGLAPLLKEYANRPPTQQKLMGWPVVALLCSVATGWVLFQPAAQPYGPFGLLLLSVGVSYGSVRALAQPAAVADL